MELLNKFPSDFFDKTRPEAPRKKPDIIPIKWSKEVTEMKRKAIVKLPSKRAR